MDLHAQRAMVERILDHLDRGTTDLAPRPFVNPASRYTCPERAQAEKDLLFLREPLFLGLSGDVANPGSWLALDEGPVPVLVVRRGDLGLAAFANVCRHRGAPVASGRGEGRSRFTCPWHGWTYDDSGALVSRPCSEAFEDLDCSLTPLAVQENLGMVFVSPVPGRPLSIEDHLDAAADELAGYGLAGHLPFATEALERRINWKLAIDTFLEAYHVPALHEKSLAPWVLGTPSLWDSHGRGGRMVAVRRSVTAERDRDPSQRRLLDHAVILHLLFPNTILIHQREHVEVVQAWPGKTPDSSVVTFRLYTPGPVESDRARAHFDRNMRILVDVVDGEDFALAERVQRGLASGVQQVVVYGRNEPGLAHFHASIDETLARAGA